MRTKPKSYQITDTKSKLAPDRIRVTDPGRFAENYRALTDPSGRRGVAIIDQLLKSPRRRLIPIHVWEDLVHISIYEACTNWDPDRTKKCPIRNYVWRCLHWKALGWWSRNKHTILNQVELDTLDPD